jgi:tetratricopeptide (TPR) repeat protein
MTQDIGDQVRELTKSRAYTEALSLCNEELAKALESERPSILRMRAYVHGCMKNHNAEVADLSEALASVPDDSRFLFDRARAYMEVHRFAEAMTDLEKLLDQELRNGSEWYLGTARLLQAVCLVHQRRAEEALRLCGQLPPGTKGWVLGKLQTREALEHEARAMSKR